MKSGEQNAKDERIPEKLWESAIELLDYYPFHKVRNELNLNTKQIQQRAEASGKPLKQRRYKTALPHSKTKGAFLELSASALTNTQLLSNNGEMANGEKLCRIVMQRVDGSRLTLSLPVELNAWLL
ncbi:MAG: hypothetical protein AB1489_43705 [Acidobacteriota bacterium]